MLKDHRIILLLTILWSVSAASGEVTVMKLELPPTGHAGFFAFAFSPDGKTLSGGTGVGWTGDKAGGKVKYKSMFGGEVVLWDAQTGKLMKTLGRHGASVTWLSYSRDGRTLASASEDNGTVKFWNAQTCRLKQTLSLKGNPGALTGVLPFPTASPDSMIAVTVAARVTKGKNWTVSEPKQMTVWDVKTDKALWNLPRSNVHQACFSPNGKTLVGYVWKESWLMEKGKEPTGTVSDPHLAVWDARTGKMLRIINRGNHYGRIVYLPDGKTVVVLRDRSLELWNVGRGALQREQKLESELESLQPFAFSSDGGTLASMHWHYPQNFTTGSEGHGELELFDLLTGRSQTVFETKPAQGWWGGAVAISPDLKRLACLQDGRPVLVELGGRR